MLLAVELHTCGVYVLLHLLGLLISSERSIRVRKIALSEEQVVFTRAGSSLKPTQTQERCPWAVLPEGFSAASAHDARRLTPSFPVEKLKS